MPSSKSSSSSSVSSNDKECCSTTINGSAKPNVKTLAKKLEEQGLCEVLLETAKKVESNGSQSMPNSHQATCSMKMQEIENMNNIEESLLSNNECNPFHEKLMKEMMQRYKTEEDTTNQSLEEENFKLEKRTEADETNGKNEKECSDGESSSSSTEHKRLKKLTYAAFEFLNVQRRYVHYLQEMTTKLPEYLENYGKRIRKDLLADSRGEKNVIIQIKNLFSQIQPTHQALLGDMEEKWVNWNPTTPNISSAVSIFADHLKCCQNFLFNKTELLDHLIEVRRKDKLLDGALTEFEVEVFKRGKKGAVGQQLDQVHQNFMRYKLLMLRYSEYLVVGSEEKEKAEETIEKLESVAQAVSQQMMSPTTVELMDLNHKFQLQFDVFEPGRVLVRQGTVLKQTRKEEQPRYLVLFTDCLWICRMISPQSPTTSVFNMNRSYNIDLANMQFERMATDEYTRCLKIQSDKKSSMIIFKTEKERNGWADDLDKAQNQWKSYKKRQSIILRRESKMMDEISMLSERTINEEGQEGKDMESSSNVSAARSMSSDSDNDEIGVEPDMMLPVWLPDNISNECLMEGCSTEFSMIRRRHHCRECGWLICNSCAGEAPLAKYHFKKQTVCPECYDSQYSLYKTGRMFPENTDPNQYGKSKKLFKPPTNIGLKHINVLEKQASSIVFGKVYLRKRTSESVCYGLIRREDLQLMFFRAELDSKVDLEFSLSEHVYHETEIGGDWLFEFRKKESEKIVVAFRVEKASAKKWMTALKDVLEKFN